MVRRITMAEASASFKDILERAMADGDGYDVESDGKVVLYIRPPLPSGDNKLTLGEFLRELNERAPVDDTFADDLQAAIDTQPLLIPEDPWEKYGNDSRHEHPNRDRA